MKLVHLLFPSGLVLAMAACDSGTTVLAPHGTAVMRTDRTQTTHDPVSVRAVAFAPSSLMVTAAIARVECSGAIRALQVSYDAATDTGSTPRFSVSSCPVEVDVLGLLPSTEYRTHITAWGDHDEARVLDGPALVTGPLPPGLPAVSTHGKGRQRAGLTAFAVFPPSQVPSYALIVDSEGRVRWYLIDPHRFLIDLQPQPNGHYTLSATPTQLSSEFEELDIAGNSLRRWRDLGGFLTDVHELRLVDRGTALLLGDANRTIDLTVYGGSPTAVVGGNVLERVDSAGRLLFVWNAFDHLSITDIDPLVSLKTAFVDWNHGNAIEVDGDGNYLVSFRDLSEIVKIDSGTGDVKWRWGGVKNQFQFYRDTLRFSFQHGIRRLRNGNYILFDNGNARAPRYSRAVEYALDQTKRTATLVWSYRPSPDIFSPFLGFAQRLTDGNTLVTFGPQGTVHEVSQSGQLIWELTVASRNSIYRAYRIRSLYDPRLVEEPMNSNFQGPRQSSDR